MDFAPREVLVDFESMSGLVQFERPQDYNLFFKKYQEYCSNHSPLFECIPYNFPNEDNENDIENKEMINNNNNPMFYGSRSMGPMPRQFNIQQGPYNYRNMNNINNNFQNRKNNNIQNFQNTPQGMNNIHPYQNMPPYGLNSSMKNDKFFNGNNNNNNFQNYLRDKFTNNNNKGQRQNYNNNNNYQNQNNQLNHFPIIFQFGHVLLRKVHY